MEPMARFPNNGVKLPKTVHITAASKFAGCKEGKVFKLGVQGLGYYDDDGLSALALFWPWGGP